MYVPATARCKLLVLYPTRVKPSVLRKPLRRQPHPRIASKALEQGMWHNKLHYSLFVAFTRHTLKSHTYITAQLGHLNLIITKFTSICNFVCVISNQS